MENIKTVSSFQKINEKEGKKNVGGEEIQTASGKVGQMEEVEGAEVKEDRAEQEEISEGEEEI